jgi:hypothetical protein
MQKSYNPQKTYGPRSFSSRSELRKRSLMSLGFSPFARHYSGNRRYATLNKWPQNFTNIHKQICGYSFFIRSNLCKIAQRFFSFPPATKMFQFAGLSSHQSMCSTGGPPPSWRGGFPIRRSPGQRLLATLPRLIAGCCVLHRLLKSRHPPYTLNFIFPTFLFLLDS